MSLDAIPSDLLADLPRGRDAEHIGTPPHSYFESPQNLAATESLRFDADRNDASKLFLGVVGGQVVTGERLRDGRVPRHVAGGTPIGLGDDRHHVLIAGSRAGKGRSCLVPVLLTNPSSMVCLDPKGDHARLTANYRAHVLRHKVVVFDPFGVSGPGTEQFRGTLNVIEILKRSDRRTFVPNAHMIANSLIVEEGEVKDPHWNETSRQAAAMLSAHTATHVRYSEVQDLVTVWHLASQLTAPDPDNPKRYWLEQELLANDAGGGMIRNSARQFYSRTGGEFSSIVSNLQRHLNFLGIECMRDCLTGPSVDLRELPRGGTTIFSSMPAMRTHDTRGFQRLVVEMTLAAHEEERTPEGAGTVALLDEFHILGFMRSLELAAAQFSGQLKLITVLQDLTQAQKNYPKSWETFIGNAGCLQVFGLADHTTQDYISKRLGECPTITRSTNSPGFDQATQHAATGESWSLGTHRLLTPEEVGRFFARDDKQLRQLILRPGYRPAILQRAFYDQHELFKGRFADA